MTLENERLHLHITELEARLAEEQARAERARSCLAAFQVDPDAITPEAAARIYEQWQCDWDQAAKDGADAHNFKVERDKLQEALAHERAQLEQTQQVLRDRGVDLGQCAALLPQRVDQAIGNLQAELAGLEDRFNQVTAERTKYRLALQAIAESGFSGFAWLKARETLGLATAGEGEVAK